MTHPRPETRPRGLVKLTADGLCSRMKTSSQLSPAPSPPLPALPPVSTHTLTNCPELDLSVSLSPAPKRTDSVHAEEPVVVRDAPLMQPTCSYQFRRGHHHGGGVFNPSVAPPAGVLDEECGGLETVQLNTTLGLKAKLHALQAAEFNSHNAVQESLCRSERTKNLINTKATKVVNVSRSRPLFTDLVSVNVQTDQLICQVIEDKPRSLSHVDTSSDGPSRLLFMSSDLLRQKHPPLGADPGHYKPLLSSRPLYSTFDLCMKQRQWEATP